jgi:hypothetical protein
MATMQQIEDLMEKLSAVRDALAGTALAMDEEQTELERKYAPRIRKLTVKFHEANAALSAAVAESPDLFVKPRSVLLHGIQAGFRKGTGKIEWEDGEDVCRLIRKHFPEHAELLIKTVESPVKSAMNELPTSDLKKIGVQVEDTGDVPFVKLADKEAAKLVRAILRQAAKQPAEEDAA